MLRRHTARRSQRRLGELNWIRRVTHGSIENCTTEDQVLIAELHSHPPGAGGQNAVDAANGATTYPGFLTIVVPNFANPLFYDLQRTTSMSMRRQGGGER